MKVSPSCVTSEVCPADVGVQLGHLADVLSGFPAGLFRDSSYPFCHHCFLSSSLHKVIHFLPYISKTHGCTIGLTNWHTVTSVPSGNRGHLIRPGLYDVTTVQ